LFRFSMTSLMRFMFLLARSASDWSVTSVDQRFRSITFASSNTEGSFNWPFSSISIMVGNTVDTVTQSLNVY
jgi:hypothetical protein